MCRSVPLGQKRVRKVCKFAKAAWHQLALQWLSRAGPHAEDDNLALLVRQNVFLFQAALDSLLLPLPPISRGLMPALSDLPSATEGSAFDSAASSTAATTEASGSLPHPSSSRLNVETRPNPRRLGFGVTARPAERAWSQRESSSARSTESCVQLRLLTPDRPPPGQQLFDPNAELRAAAPLQPAADAYSESLMARHPPEAQLALLRLQAGEEQDRSSAGERQSGANASFNSHYF